MEFCQVKDVEELLTELGDSRQIESRIIDFIVSSRNTDSHSYSGDMVDITS